MPIDILYLHCIGISVIYQLTVRPNVLLLYALPIVRKNGFRMSKMEEIAM